MGRRCCIAGCASTSRLAEHHGVTYHSFPLDATIRSIWVKNTRLSADRTITKSVLVCSRHFRRIDFQPQRSGKYLLKQRVFPTVFPWGRVDAAQIEEDLEILKNASLNTTLNSTIPSVTPVSNEDETTATVEATVAQIMAEAAELSAKSNEGNLSAGEKSSLANNTSAGGVRFQRVTNFSPGVRLEAQDFDGIWHTARVVEVDNDDCEVLIKFEKTGKTKSAVVGSEEWIPMNSTRLRQKISAKPIPVFELEEKCLARWTGPRKFPGTVKQILGNDVYEVLFDDGYVKNVRAVHMNKIPSADDVKTPNAESPSVVIDVTPTSTATSSNDVTVTAVASPAQNTAITLASPKAGSNKKRAAVTGRKDWPLLDMSKLDIASLNLPEIPRDGEWTCHWVNDQPIGREGFLVVGEHRKPTVIVDDWRLPTGWVKHMYQRSNVLGKWDVILVTPNNKRFRSKADLKVYLEEQGEIYNPDIYDFSIHRRRAKDINAYVFTPDYKPSQAGSKSKTPVMTSTNEPEEKNNATDSSQELTAEETKAALENSLASNLSFMETPVASYLPPIELMTSPTKMDSMDEDDKNIDKFNMPFTEKQDNGEEKIYVYIGSLKVQIIDNLFHCPEDDCEKYFRKENHLQIHIKHYHRYLENLLGDCPKMMELAEKRTIAPDLHEPQPKNQIPNQQFFAKLHQQDIQQSRANRKKSEMEFEIQPQSRGNRKKADTPVADIKTKTEIMNTNSFSLDYQCPISPMKQPTKIEIKDEKKEIKTETITKLENEATTSSSIHSIDKKKSISPIDTSTPTIMLKDEENVDNTMSTSKRMRFSPNKRFPASRKSNRQRTSRHYFTPSISLASNVTGDMSIGDLEEHRHDIYDTSVTSDKNSNADIKIKKRKSGTYSSAAYALMNTDSGSGSLTPYYANSGDVETDSNQLTQYIKEDGEFIKIVHMRQEEIINCLCQYGEEDGLMIQCELCLCWQHGGCNGIEKEADVPDKYVCYICRNAPKARESMRLKHDQDWLFEGKLPTANFHAANPDLLKRFEFLKRSHTLTGNLLDLKRVMYSLRVKINIANNRCHPKLYLWAKNWDEEETINDEDEEDENDDSNTNNDDTEADDDNENSTADEEEQTSTEKDEEDSTQLHDDGTATTTTNTTPTLSEVPNIPQPEAPIDPEECQERLINHIKIQQSMVNKRLDDIALEIDELESQDQLEDLKYADTKTIKETLATFIHELQILKQLAKLNALENAKKSSAVNA